MLVKGDKKNYWEQKVFQFTPPDNANQIEISERHLTLTPNAVAYADKEFTVGGRTYDPYDLVKQNILAVVVRVPGKSEADVYDFNGNKIGTIDISYDASKGEEYNQRKMMNEFFKLGDKGLLLLKRNKSTKFTINTYVPRVKNFGETLIQVDGYVVTTRIRGQPEK